MNKKYIIFIILGVVLNLSSFGQDLRDTIKPKKFINETTLNLDLIGKIKDVEWIIIDSLVRGNNGELFKGDFEGTIDSISFEFTKNQKIAHYKLTKYSIKTFTTTKVDSKKYKLNYTNESVLIASDFGENSEDENYEYLFQDLGYDQYIDYENDSILYLGNELITYQYNSYSDVKKLIWNTNRSIEPKETIYKYKYDNRGNWIERTEMKILNNGEEYENKRDIRQIKYFQ